MSLNLTLIFIDISDPMHISLLYLSKKKIIKKKRAMKCRWTQEWHHRYRYRYIYRGETKNK